MENMTSKWVVLLKVKVCHISPVLVQSFVLAPYHYNRHQIATFILHCTLTLYCCEIVLVLMAVFEPLSTDETLCDRYFSQMK
jgi:hypothetical protein